MKLVSVLLMGALLLGACGPGGPVAPAGTATAGPLSGQTSAPTAATPTPAPVAPVQTAPSLPASAAVQVSPVYSVADALGYVDTYLVDPGLDDPNPPPGGRVVLRAKLIKNGLRLWFAPTHVTWMQGGELQVCDFLPMYLAGCTIDVLDFAPGVFVPVTLTMRYNGMVFTGYTGFTPR